MALDLFHTAFGHAHKVFLNAIQHVITLEPLAAKTLVFTPYMGPLEAAAGVLVKQAGIDILTAKYLLAMLAGYPLALVFRAIPGRTLKNVFALVVGVVLSQFVFGPAWIHGVVSSGVAYTIVAMAHVLGGVLRQWQHVIVFLWMMMYMTASHLYRLEVDYGGWSPDFTGPQMLITMKITMFAFNYHDGVTERNKLAATAASTDPKKGGAARQAKSRLALGLDQLPSPLEFFAWIYHFSLYFAGPAFELRRYQDSLSGAAYLMPVHKPTGASRAPLPLKSAIAAGLQKLLTALLSLGAFELAKAFVPFEAQVNPKHLAITSFTGILSRLPFLWLSLIGVQTKYYFAWRLTEGSANMCGFGFQPLADKDAPEDLGVADWNGASQVDIFGFQTASSIQAMSRAWNQRTQWWLEHYVYRRAPRVASINMLTTYFVSAFWHGFYPGYYLFFMSIPLFSILDKRMRRVFNPLFYQDKQGNSSAVAIQVQPGKQFVEKIYHLVCILATTLATHYLVTSFVSLSWDKGLAIWASFHYAGHVAAVGLHILISLISVAGLLPRVGAPKPAEAKKTK